MNTQPIESPEPTSHDADPLRPGTPGEPQIPPFRLPPGDEAPGDPADLTDLPGVIQPPERPGFGPKVPKFPDLPPFGIPTPPPIMPIGPKPTGTTPLPFPTRSPRGGLPPTPPDSSWQKFSPAFRTSGQSPLRLHFKVNRGTVIFELAEWILGISQTRWSATLRSGECAVVAEEVVAKLPSDRRCRLFTVNPSPGGGIWQVTAIGGENEGGDLNVSGNVEMR